MTRNYLKGHEIILINGVWLFEDTREPTETTWKKRPCFHCSEHETTDGHDACLGTLPGIMNAC